MEGAISPAVVDNLGEGKFCQHCFSEQRLETL